MTDDELREGMLQVLNVNAQAVADALLESARLVEEHPEVEWPASDVADLLRGLASEASVSGERHFGVLRDES